MCLLDPSTPAIWGVSQPVACALDITTPWPADGPIIQAHSHLSRPIAMLFVEPGLVRVQTTPFRLLLSPIALRRVPNKDIIAPCYPSVTPECPAAKPRVLLSRLHAAANYGVAWAPGTDPWFASSLASPPASKVRRTHRYHCYLQQWQCFCVFGTFVLHRRCWVACALLFVCIPFILPNSPTCPGRAEIVSWCPASMPCYDILQHASFYFA